MKTKATLIALVLLIATLAPTLTQAEELLNDGWANGRTASFQAGFVTGEIGAVRLVPTIAGTWPLQNVQLLFGGATTSQSVVLHIWDDSALANNPGVELYTATYQLQGADDAMNEIDLSLEGVVVSGPIRVGIEFTHSGTPSIARDDDGSIDAPRNYIMTGGAWYQSNLFGLTGDWIIRANTNTTATTYTVGGTVSGLTGSLTLQNNAGDDLVINADGPFTFATSLGDGATYNVTVLNEPVGQTCTVTAGAGTIASANITNVAVACSDGTGGPVTLANDGFVDGGVAGFQGGFVTGEIAAARLTTPSADAWAVDHVEFLFGGATTQQTVTLKIWDDNGGTNAPGAELYSGDFLVTGGDLLQQIDLSAAGLNVTGDFRVGLQFQHTGFPSVARDDDGIVADRNFIFTSTSAWFESGFLGLTGDWIIRAQVSQAAPAEPFAITAIDDFPNDQGRQVRLTWPNSPFDASGSATPVTGYAIFRRIDPGLKSNSLKAYPEGDWDFLRTVPAFQEVTYSTIVATAADSTIADGMHYSAFFVRAMTASPGVFFDSAPDSGYSVDNLVPATPQGLFVAYSGVSGNSLSWQESPDSDFMHFKIYRGTTPDFAIDPGAASHLTTGTDWIDTSGGFGDYYRISAVDFSGNESPVTDTLDTQVSGVDDDLLPRATALHPVYPNPFNPRTTISFAMVKAGHAKVSIFDVSGRFVQTILEQDLAGGTHEVVWQGTDSDGRALASGVFFARLEADGFVGTQRMVLVR